MEQTTQQPYYAIDTHMDGDLTTIALSRDLPLLTMMFNTLVQYNVCATYDEVRLYNPNNKQTVLHWIDPTYDPDA